MMLPPYGCSFEMMIVPLAANMPADAVAHRRFWLSGSGGGAAHLAHAPGEVAFIDFCEELFLVRIYVLGHEGLDALAASGPSPNAQTP
jgi:hypothetical protein